MVILIFGDSPQNGLLSANSHLLFRIRLRSLIDAGGLICQLTCLVKIASICIRQLNFDVITGRNAALIRELAAVRGERDRGIYVGDQFLDGTTHHRHGEEVFKERIFFVGANEIDVAAIRRECQAMEACTHG